jgi:hypothetical protein
MASIREAVAARPFASVCSSSFGYARFGKKRARRSRSSRIAKQSSKVQAVQTVQNVSNGWNTLNELNRFAGRSIARFAVFLRGGEQVIESRAARVAVNGRDAAWLELVLFEGLERGWPAA